MSSLLSMLGYLLAAVLPGIVFFFILFALGTLQAAVSVLFYRGLLLALIAMALQLVLVSLFPALRRDPALILAALALSLAANVIVLVVVPVTLDRSVSVFLLGQLAKNPDGLAEEALEERLIEDYVIGFGAVERRMDEQTASGNVEIVDGKYRLTAQGRRFIAISTPLAKAFGADLRYLRGGSSTEEGANREE